MMNAVYNSKFYKQTEKHDYINIGIHIDNHFYKNGKGYSTQGNGLQAGVRGIQTNVHSVRSEWSKEVYRRQG